MEIGLIIFCNLVLIPILGYFWMLLIEKENKQLNSEKFIVRWSKSFFYITFGFASILLFFIIYALVILKFPSNLYCILFVFPILFLALVFCHYFLRKRLVVSIEEQSIIYYPAFKKKHCITFCEIFKVEENQHSMSIYKKNSQKKVCSIGHEYVGYEQLKKELKRIKGVVFEYNEIGYGKSF